MSVFFGYIDAIISTRYEFTGQNIFSRYGFDDLFTNTIEFAD